jgi:hypothetical protein
MSNSDPSTRDIIATHATNLTLTRPPLGIFCIVLRPVPSNSLTSHPHLLVNYVFFFYDKRPLIRFYRYISNLCTPGIFTQRHQRHHGTDRRHCSYNTRHHAGRKLWPGRHTIAVRSKIQTPSTKRIETRR